MKKRQLEDLAAWGGPPAFREPLHVGRPGMLDRERFVTEVEGILDRGWLSNDGPCVKRLEQRIADYLGVQHCVCVCNGTIALEIAIRAAALTGRVIVPSFTFIATAHALQWQGIRPVFCEVDPATHNIDPTRVEALIDDETTGILAAHVWGRPCAVESLEEIASRHGLRLIFDAAPAFGCSYRGHRIGNFGDMEIFSFHATKFLGTLEGGAIVTNDGILAQKARLMRNFGFEDYDRVVYLGTNGKLNEVSAAMGLVQLDQLEARLERNRDNYLLYRRLLDGLPGIRVMPYDESEENNYHYVCVEVTAAAGLSRDELVRYLHAENILARRYFYPGCHRMEPYRTLYPDVHLPVTDELAARVMCLPTGVAMTEADVVQVCDCFRFLIRNWKRILAAKQQSPDLDRAALSYGDSARFRAV